MRGISRPRNCGSIHQGNKPARSDDPYGHVACRLAVFLLARRKRGGVVITTAQRDESEMQGDQFSDDARRQWLADTQAKREAVLKALSTETDPKMQRRLQASARRYKAMLAMGPERTKAGAGHSRYASRREASHV